MKPYNMTLIRVDRSLSRAVGWVLKTQAALERRVHDVYMTCTWQRVLCTCRDHPATVIELIQSSLVTRASVTFVLMQ